MSSTTTATTSVISSNTTATASVNAYIPPQILL
jgi:hypothetical protein